jgi:hypothetical protein
MPVDWLTRKKETGEIELNNDAVTGIVKPQLDAVKTEINSSMDAKFKPMLDFINEQKEAKAEAVRQAAAKTRREENETDPTDWITDPESAVDKKIRPLQETIQAQNAIIMRGQTLDKMDYYSSDPEFKNRVDKLIDSQPLHLRANAGIIMAAYKNTHYDMQQEIKDGKVKSQASLLSNAGGGTGGHSGSSSSRDTDNDIMSEEEKNYARKLGISEKDWTSTKKELEYV